MKKRTFFHILSVSALVLTIGTGILPLGAETASAEDMRTAPTAFEVPERTGLENMTPGAVSPDIMISRNVHSELEDAVGLARYGFFVETKDGIVTLSGAVRDREESNQAEMVARNVEGVRGVLNELDMTDEHSHAHDPNKQ